MVWEKIKNFPDYKINKEGEVITTHYLHHNIIKKLKPRKSKNGYYSVYLYKDGKGYSKLIHRLVAETFIPNPKKLSQVNHINGDKTNNNINNLEWISPANNIRHAIKNNLINRDKLLNTTKIMSQNNKKTVLQFDLEGEFIAEYNSAKEAAMLNNLSNVGACCRGKYKTAGGYIWRYKNE